MSLRSLRAVPLAALLALLAGCSSGGDTDPIVAEAGDIRITLAQFHDAYNRITPENRPDISTLEARRAFADDLLNKEIVLAEARRMGEDPSIEATAERTVLQKALEMLYRAEITDKVEVQSEDIQRVYEARAFNVKGSHILVEDLSEADGILQEIRSGKIPFEEAAEKYSMDLATREKGGRIGELVWSMALPDFQLELFGMQPGEMKAFDGTIGGHVLRLDARIPQELPSPQEARQALRSDVRRQLEAVRLREFMAELEEKAGLTWNDEGLKLCEELMHRNAAVDSDALDAKDRYVPVAADEEKSVVIASFSGRDWTVGDFLEGLRKVSAGQRPRELPRRALREFIRTTQLRDELSQAEALARGLDKDPAVLVARDRQVEQMLVDQVMYHFVQASEVPPERVRAVYDSTLNASPEALEVPEHVNLVLLVHTDSTVVAQGLARIRAGEDEASVIRELSVDFRSAVKGGRTGPITRGTYADELDEVAFATEPGSGWSPPIVTPTGTGAFRVLEHQDAHTATFDEVREQLAATLRRNEGTLAFEDWLRAERERRGVVFHDDVLEKVGQPGP